MATPYVPEMHNTRRYDKLNNLINNGGVIDADGQLTQKGSVILDYLNSQYAGNNAPEDRAVLQQLWTGVGGNSRMTLDTDGGWGQTVNNALSVLSGQGSDNLNPRDILNRLREIRTQNDYASKLTPDQQVLVDKYGLRFGEDGMRRRSGDVMGMVQQIEARKNILQEQGLAPDQVGAKDLYGTLGRTKNDKSGTTIQEFRKTATDTATGIKLSDQERDLNISPELAKGKTFQQRQLLIDDATARRKSARALMDRYEALGPEGINHPGYRKALEDWRNPAGKSQRLLNGGGAQSTLPTTGSAVLAAVPGATQTPQTPTTQTPAAPASSQLSLEDLESRHQGGQTAGEVRAARERQEEAAVRRELREVNDYNLRQWEAITRANATITDQLNNLEIERMKQDGAMQRWREEKEYDKATREREQLINAIGNVGANFSAFFGNMF